MECIKICIHDIDEEIMNGVTRESVEANMTLADKWIISRANNVVKKLQTTWISLTLE